MTILQKLHQDLKLLHILHDCPVAAVQNTGEEPVCRSSSIRKYSIQKKERQMLSNFVYNVCECAGDWKMDVFRRRTRIKAIREKVGDGKVLLRTVWRCGLFCSSRLCYQKQLEIS